MLLLDFSIEYLWQLTDPDDNEGNEEGDFNCKFFLNTSYI